MASLAEFALSGGLMKLEIRLENGNPILFFTDSENRDKTIDCYTQREEHSSAARAYMRSLKKPSTGDELGACWALLGAYGTNFKI